MERLVVVSGVDKWGGMRPLSKRVQVHTGLLFVVY